MNERIRELAKGALDYAEKNQSAEVQQHWFKLYNEKFAELIVRECAGVVEDAVNHREPASTYVDKIREHFGVEE